MFKIPMTDSKVIDFLAAESPLPRAESKSLADRRRSNINVAKSVMLLNDAVGSPGYGSKTPIRPRTVSRVPFTPQATLSMSMLETTVPLTPGWFAAVTPAKQDNTMMTQQLTGGGELTTTNLSVMVEELPDIASSTGLYEDFMKALKLYRSEQEIFDLVQKYEDLCKDQVDLLCKVSNLTNTARAKFSKLKSVLFNLTAERSTWALLQALYRDRLEMIPDEDDAMLVEQQVLGLSERSVMQALFERDPVTRQAQIIVDWLEQSAETALENYFSHVQFSTSNSVAWENTLHILQQKSRSVPSASSIQTLLVTEMDPDAPLRHKRPLADLDLEDEDRLFKYMFALIRAGQLDEAQQLCIRCGQAWRAASLEGWRLFHDPNYDGFGESAEIQPIEGNMYRDVWRSVAWAMAEDEQIHPLERAIYATYSGNLKPLLSACKTWHDYVWAYAKVLVDNRVEQEVQVHCKISGMSTAELPQYPSDFRSLFKEIEASPNDAVRKDLNQSFNIIQKYVILGDFDGLLDVMYGWLQAKDPPSEHLLRFMAHIVLFNKLANLSMKDELCVAILEAYVSLLIDEKYNDLVAGYVATLPDDRQVLWYAKFLEGIHERVEREQCLILADEEGLDVPSITKLVVENIRAYGAADFTINTAASLEGCTTQEDRLKIEAIDWLVFDKSQRAEAMRQANAVMRSFIALQKHEAARAVFNKIPDGSIDLIHKNTASQGLTELVAMDENAVREYLCIQAYLDANDSFNDWFKHSHHAKPEKPAPPNSDNFTDIVAYEHKEKQYEADLERWQHSLMLQSRTTVERMYNVLLFVDGGWMADVRQAEDDSSDTRRHQMELLRRLCLPTICFLLHKVLHTTEQFHECLELSDLVASERHQLYKVFPQEDLQKLMRLLQESSISLLERGVDPLGYT